MDSASDRFAALGDAFAGNRLDEAGARELLALIDAEPARLRELRRSTSVDTLLRRRDAPALPDQVMSALPTPTRRIRIAEGVMQRLPLPAARQWWRRKAWLLAAGLVLAAGATAWGLLGSPVVAEIGSVRGVAVILHDGARSSPAPGARLRGGDRLELAAGSRLDLDEFAGGKPDGTRLVVSGPAALVIADAAAARVVTLESGTIEAEVAPRAPGHPLLVRTPQAQATIVGTRFTIAVGGDGTRLDVEAGTVALATDAGATLTVGAGSAALADGAGLRPTAAWIQLIPVDPLRVSPDRPPQATSWRVGEDAEGRFLIQDSLLAAASGNLRVVPDTRAGIITGDVLVRTATDSTRAGWALRPAGATFSPGTVVSGAFLPTEVPPGTWISFRVTFRLDAQDRLGTEVTTWPRAGAAPPPAPRTSQTPAQDGIHAFDGISLFCEQGAVEFRNLRYRPLEP